MAAPAPHPSDPAARARPAGLLRPLAALLALTLLLPLPLLMPSDGQAAAPLLGDADVHVDSGELEINVALSQTQNTCGATALNGQFCLRYSAEQDETPLASGYGVIAPSDVKTSGAGVTLSTNTAVDPAFQLLKGRGACSPLRGRRHPLWRPCAPTGGPRRWHRPRSGAACWARSWQGHWCKPTC